MFNQRHIRVLVTALAFGLTVGAACTTQAPSRDPSCGDGGDDLPDINRDGRADESDCVLIDAARATKATCELIDGLWWSQSECSSETAKDLATLLSFSPWERVRALPNSTLALLRPEGLTIVSARTGTRGIIFPESPVIPDFGDRLVAIGPANDIAMAASSTRAWYDRNNDSTPTPDEIVDITRLGDTFLRRLEILRINGHAAAASEVQGQVIAWQDLNDDLAIEQTELISLTASRFLGVDAHAIYFSLLDVSYALVTDPWAFDPSRVVPTPISSLCQALVSGTTSYCTTSTGQLLDAVDGHQMSGNSFSSYRHEGYLIGRRVGGFGPAKAQLWIDLDHDGVEQASERFTRDDTGSLAAFDATIGITNDAEPYTPPAVGISLMYGPSGSGDPLRVLAWRRSRALAFAGEPCLANELCPTGYVCEQNGTASQPACVVDVAVAR